LCHKRYFFVVAAVLFASIGWPLAAVAQSYPIKPVRVVVGFAPGGGTDISARTISQKLAEALGQPFVVDNRPGAGGTIGNALVATAPADGYTLLVTANGPHAIGPHLYKSVGYDVLKDYAAISVLTTNPFALVVHPAVAAGTVKELIAWAKANPKQANFSSAGTGTPSHLSGELFNVMAGVKLTHVPFKGAAPGFAALLGGEVNVMFGEMLTVAPHLKGGKLRAIAVTTAERSTFMPELPTIAESGLSGYDVSVWYAMFAPARTPKAIVTRLNAETVRALQTAEVKDRFAKLGSTASPTTPAELDAIVKRDYERWGRVIKNANIKTE
jgi:tripartite-type tricarboxylate transporter receptor subunit TctC